MPECVFVLLGPWNRYRCFLKDERNGMGALHTRLQNLPRMHNSLIFFPRKEMRVTSFGLLTLMGVACFLLLIIVSCSDMIHSPAFFTAFPLMILDRFERARMFALGLYLVLALADNVSVSVS